MPFTHDTSTSLGKVRSLIGDTDQDNVFLQDADITVFLDLEDGSIYRAAAVALQTMATKHINILKKIELLDLKTDAASMARELRELANSFLKRATESEDESFDVIEMVNNDFQYREKMNKEILKEAV